MNKKKFMLQLRPTPRTSLCGVRRTHKASQGDFHMDVGYYVHRIPMSSKKFIICGLTGWCIEVAFTSVSAAIKKDKKMMGQTSAWMFPIYGMAAGIDLIYPKIKNWSTFHRGLLYGLTIMTGEYITGSMLTAIDACPWSYDDAKYSIKGIVRPDYLPYWMVAGLLYEKLLLEIDGEKQ